MVNQFRRSSGLSTAINNTLGHIGVAEALKPNYQVKLAITFEEKIESFQMTYDSYLEKGFVSSGSKPLNLFVIDHDQEDETVIFNVYHEGNQLAGTMTLVFDVPRKIPCEVLFSDELNQLRKNGLRLAEVTRLVIDKHFRNSTKVLEMLIDLMMAYCYHNDKADTLICEVHPHHKRFYTKLLGFREISEEKPCPMVNDSPAVALAMPLSIYAQATKEETKPKYKYYKNFTPFHKARRLAYEAAEQHKPLTTEELWTIGIGEIVFETI